MKCVNCGVDNNLKDRTANQGKCTNCNHTFAFEPTSQDAKYKFTDPFFQKVITDISVNNSLYFTPKQFFYALDKRVWKKSTQINTWKGFGFFLIFPPVAIFTFGISLIVGLAIIFIKTYLQSQSPENKLAVRKGNAKFLQISGIAILILGISSALSIESFSLFIISVILGMPLIYLGTIQINRLKNAAEIIVINQDLFQDWVNRWQQINGLIPNMLPATRQENTPSTINPDITAYSFDRVVVCDRTEIAQFLIANNFHFENNCAVLSINGYPQNIFSTVMEMLRRNPDLKVYALHNASPRGVTLINHLRTSSNWFLNTNVTIFDLGLLPRQFINKSKALIQASEEFARDARNLSIDVKQSLNEAEIAWLESGKFVELESFSPQRLLRIVTQGIIKSSQLGANDSLIGIDDDYNHGSGMTILAYDSFG